MRVLQCHIWEDEMRFDLLTKSRLAEAGGPLGSMTALAVVLMLGSAPALQAQEWKVADVPSVLQTKALTEADGDADADDPSVFIHPTDPAKSLIVAAAKEGGILVYGLDGEVIQALGVADGGRINNVDVLYGFPLADGSPADLVVASDRGLDIIRVYRIDGDAAAPLTEITDPAGPRAFPSRNTADGSAVEDNPVDDQNTVYGLTTWHDKAGGNAWVVGTQRHQPTVGIFKLEARDGGVVAAVLDHAFSAPTEHAGQSLWQENDDNPLLDFSPQFEGVVVDRTTGTIYAGQEDVGIWVVPVTGGEPVLGYETRGSAESSFHNPDSVITRDVEGLTIYYAADGTRYLLASSQGGAHGDKLKPDAPYHDSFVAFSLDAGLTPLGSFHVAATGDRDAVQESDGSDVISVGLPGFENGVFIAQDGYAGDLNNLDGEVASTGFKFVDWAEIAKSFTPPLAVTPTGWDPRQ